MKKHIVSFIICILIVVVGVLCSKRILSKISYGIDLQGGFEILTKLLLIE